MVIYKLRLPVVLAVLVWLCSIPAYLFGQDIVLPGGQIFTNNYSLFPMPGLTGDKQPLSYSEGMPIQLKKNGERPGFFSFRYTSKKKQLPELADKGHLDVFLYVHPDLKKVGFDTTGKFDSTINYADRSGPVCLKSNPGKEEVCQVPQSDMLEASEGASVPIELGQQAIHLQKMDVTFADINFVNPMVIWESGNCRVNGARPVSTCSAVNTVIMRYTSANPDSPVVVVAHTLDHGVFTEAEQIISDSDGFLDDDKKLNAMADKVLEFKYARSRQLIGTGWGAYFKNLIGYYWYGTPWIYERDLLFPSYPTLPREGIPTDFIDTTAKLFKEYHHSKWKKGKVSGTIYSGDLDHYDFLNKMHGYFSHDNAIQFDLAPGAIYFESNTISMVRSILGGRYIKDQGLGGPDGIITGGGTTSIKAALKAYKNRARAMGITEPEIIIPVSVHPAFERGADDYGMKVVKARIFKGSAESSFQVDLRDVEKKITSNTVLLVGSATNYPYGTTDSIRGLASLARKYDLDLHVDACLGGFVLAFLDLEQYGLEPFDFRIPEVTSMSIDTHKYGKALKGSSVLLLRDRDLSDYLGYVNVEWEGGIYAAAGLAGSTSVGDYAAPWAALLKTGLPGYRVIALRLLAFAREMTDVIRSYPDELYIMGTNSMCFAFSSKPDTFDIMHVKDYLGDLDDKWRFNQVQNPSGLHFCVTGPQLSAEGLIDTFRREFDEAVRYARLMEAERKESSGGGIYGMGNLGIRFNSTEEIECFIRAGGYLLRDSTKPVTPLLKQFKEDYRRVLHKNLHMRRARDKRFDPDDI